MREGSPGQRNPGRGEAALGNRGNCPDRMDHLRILSEIWQEGLEKAPSQLLYLPYHAYFTTISFAAYTKALGVMVRNSLDNGDAAHFCLFLGNKGVDAEKMKLLTTELKHVPGIVYLDLTENPLDRKAGKSLAEFIHSQQNLKVLQLNGTHLSDQGVELVAKALQNHPSMQSLYMSLKDVGSMGRSALRKLQVKNPNLALFLTDL